MPCRRQKAVSAGYDSSTPCRDELLVDAHQVALRRRVQLQDLLAMRLAALGAYQARAPPPLPLRSTRLTLPREMPSASAIARVAVALVTQPKNGRSCRLIQHVSCLSGCAVS